MLQRQITRILLKDPFFGSLLLNLTLKEEPDMPYDMGTDGKFIYFNPTYAKKAKASNIRTTLIHELLHCVLLHITRRGNRDPKIWNIACDYVVNYYIQHSTDYYLSKDFLYKYKYGGMTAEQVYEDLLKTLPEPDVDSDYQKALGSGGKMHEPGEGDPDDIPNDGEIEVSLEEQWKANIVQAQNIAKTSGYGTSGLETMVEEILNPTLPWHIILMDLLQEQNQADYTWSRPNICFMANNIYLPSAHSQSAAELVIALDTSCSVSEEELAIMQAELNGILETIRPKSMTVIHCDTQIHKVDEYDEQDLPVYINFAGRGGTEFKPVFDYVQENIEEVKCLVYFTDLGARFNFDEPDYPVFWVNTYDKANAPMGTTLHINN